ncbi:hypothetical protein BDF21DRAFT_467400 [Thamnidium elegans]|nr:hypothetical protein BDF21DRAFT_467400 [Thamnidium elegans]
MIISSILHPAVISTSAISTVVFISWFTFWNKTKLARTEKERAYVSTLLSSSITSTLSLPLVYRLITNGGDFTDILAYSTWTVLATTFFMTFLVFDLSIGMIYYRNKIDILTGWVHHITYLFVLTWAIKTQICSAFIMMCILEVPTFLLALGSIRTQLRRDYVFASAFVLTRILFHAYAIKCAWSMDPFGPVVNALSFFFPVHCYWFYGFIKQQLRKKNQIKPQEVIPVVVVKEKPTQVIKKKPVIKVTQRRTNYTSNYTTPSLYQSPPVSVH